jgi:hypothetical protein
MSCGQSIVLIENTYLDLECHQIETEEGTHISCSNGLDFFIEASNPEIEVITLCPNLGNDSTFKEILFKINER